MKKEKLILDTSVFVNPDSAHVFGRTPTEALTRFLDLASRTENVEYLMPPSVYEEVMHFAEEKKIPKSLRTILQRQPPQKHETKVPGIFLYHLVDNMRDRVDRGLRLAERHTREALQIPPIENTRGSKGQARPDAEVIGRLRESYRRIMREGMLDSRMDVDLLLLAYETKGTLVSADQGVLLWAENLGIKLLSHEVLMEFLEKNFCVKNS